MNLPAVGVPEGYRRFDETGCTLIVRSEHAAAVRSAGFGRVDGWTTALRRVGGSGRGRAVAVALEGGTELVLKRMCRGGAFASLWRGRFAGFRRLLDNL
ncbi:MAG TPA: hypothetical protein VD788_02195, partial [Candidatus Polarisedimenticolaceae bacterium]|nr:hypothetical protein [Candidatus Polarisedimenticolaceae bacterium]